MLSASELRLFGFNVAHVAFRKQLSTLRLLVRFGAKVDCTGEDGCTPLHVAAREGYVDGVATLLQLKTDPNKQVCEKFRVPMVLVLPSFSCG